MAEIIPFPDLLTKYPDRATDLPKAECVLLVAMRVWMDGHRQNTDPMPALRHGLLVAGAPRAAVPVDAMMGILARSTRSPAAIHRPVCPCLSIEERQLLRAASFAQAGQEQLAERALRTALLSAHGAEFALGPLLGIGELFSAAHLFFQRQNASAPQTPADQGSVWFPDMQAPIVH